MPNIDTKSFILLLKKGDEKAYKELYLHYFPKLLHIATKFGSSVQSPRDFVQEAFYNVMKNRHLLNEEASLDGQMIVICKNLIINHVKREKRIENVAEFPDVWFEKTTDTAEEERTQTAKYDKLMQLVEQMPAKRKEIFIMHKIENLSYEEIEEITGLSPKTIANHLHSAKKFLQENI